MLKVFVGFVVSVAVLVSSAYSLGTSSNTYAASAAILLTQIQAGGVGAATQEYIIVYNNSPTEVDITGWCVTNKSATIACLNPPLAGQALYLPSYRHAVIASSSFAIGRPTGTVTATYVPLSQSSGSIIGSSDTISLLDHMGGLVDRQGWTTAIGAGLQFERHGTGSPLIYDDSDTATDWSMTLLLPGTIPIDETEIDTTVIDMCLNIEGVQTVVPLGKEVSSVGVCTAREIISLALSEILPNAIGSDEGQEFIELYNSHEFEVKLDAYVLLVGISDEASYHFPYGSIIQPGGYLSFSNAQIPFTLLNSSSRVGLALADEGVVISEVPAYIDPKDGQSWALIDTQWRYTNHPTPGLANLPMDVAVEALPAGGTIQLCALNQYRSPETNRCRLIATLAGTVTPCKDGQYRSEETNRCRNIATDAKIVTPCDDDEERNLQTNRCRKIVTASQPAPCKDGQERSSETHRCRTVTKMPTVDYAVLGAEAKSGSNWYVLATLGGMLLLAAGYGVWEWHEEIGKFFRKYYFKARRFARLRK